MQNFLGNFAYGAKRDGKIIMQAVEKTEFVDRRTGSRHVWFLNSAFDKIGLDTAVERIQARAADKPFAFVVTPNVDHLVRLETDTILATLYAQAWLTVCDSRILELIGRMSGEQIDIAPGSDLTQRLFNDVINPDETVTVIGGDADVIAAVTARYNLTDLRWHEPPMGLRQNRDAVEACAQFVAENPARFVFICVGSPQQEMIAEACLDRGDCKGVGLCVGASLDFLGGKAERAPKWIQSARLEWLHRLAQEPRRMWRRYLVDGPRVALLWLRWRKAQAELKAFELHLALPHVTRERDLQHKIRDLQAQLASRVD
ncbi:MAG: WecB/TagA/CpsF family glycosyltransferase [Maricaulis sp.]|nr:WecB/TagA/CpsF family glycosyltransferase [Maricaulis sp.]MDG2044752.1 WecB/TagA/CpsF family glycosyltransferase [Maricaulis sp.]